MRNETGRATGWHDTPRSQHTKGKKNLFLFGIGGAGQGVLNLGAISSLCLDPD